MKYCDSKIFRPTKMSRRKKGKWNGGEKNTLNTPLGQRAAAVEKHFQQENEGGKNTVVFCKSRRRKLQQLRRDFPWAYVPACFPVDEVT